MNENSTKRAPVLTIDGPGGAGKGSLALELATSLGWNILDSGAVYRIFAFMADKNRIDCSDIESVRLFAHHFNVSFLLRNKSLQVFSEGQNLTALIRTEEIGALASEYAAVPEVREVLFKIQRRARTNPGLVADGRDMGTTIFPDATLKVFLTASASVRAKRRYKQLKEKGLNVNLARLKNEMLARDQRDRRRDVSPLVESTDSYLIDNSNLEIKKRVLV